MRGVGPAVASLVFLIWGVGCTQPAEPEALCAGAPHLEALPGPDVLEDGELERALLRCIASGESDAARALLERGVRSEWAPAFAAAAGDSEVLRALLASGTSAEAWGPYGEVPILTLAAGRGHAAVVALLLEAGADPNLAGDAEFSGGAALATALRAGKLEVARLLLERGADADRAESYHARTPLWELACDGGDAPRRREGIELLLAHGADLERRDAGGLDGWRHSGRTPLACAIAAGDLDLARLLLERGADPNALVDGGLRILERARELGDPEAVRLLEAHGAVTDRELPSTAEVYAALAASGVEDAKGFYLLGGRRVDPERMRPPFPSFYRGRALVPYLDKDLDGDGARELAVVVQRPGARPAALLLAVLHRTEAGWRVVHRRDSLEGNPVVSAALEDIPGGIGVHVFEARYQCDDEQPVHYELRWEAERGEVVASEPLPQLHPLPRDWGCGE